MSGYGLLQNDRFTYRDWDYALRLKIQTYLLYAATQPCDLLLQIEVLKDGDQRCLEGKLQLDAVSKDHVVKGEGGLGVRRWVDAGPMFECKYDVLVEITRPAVDIESLPQTHRTQIPSDEIKYLMPSRYCHSDQFLDFVSSEFGNLSGGARVAEMCRWISRNFTYDNSVSNSGTTASDSFASLKGVCRDYAHVLISFTRAAGIPARFVSVYAPDVSPQDFHAVVEVYLGGGWHILDPTGMAKPEEIARICVGRDAADSSLIMSYGRIDLITQTVEVMRNTA